MPLENTSEITRSPLTALRCPHCGFVTYPAHSFGCERCGAPGADLQTAELSGRAEVVSSVATKLDEAPAVVGSLRFEEGPVLVGYLDVPAPLAAGTTVVAFAPYSQVPTVRFRIDQER